jgi:hypothetical protein
MPLVASAVFVMLAAGVVSVFAAPARAASGADPVLTVNTTADLPGTNPHLGPLANNGGPTDTLALLPGSPATNAADSAGRPATDQRGVPHPPGHCDIGAFQLVPT